MKSTREQLEEIWPVPEGVYWDCDNEEYLPRDYKGCDAFYDLAVEWDARLDTFTRCQETTAVYLGLIDELVQSLQWYVDEDEINEGQEGNEYWVTGKHAAEELIIRAKQKLEKIK